MADLWFDPDAIRGDIEGTLTEYFQPPVFSATSNYAQGDITRLNGLIYKAALPTIGVTPPAAPWELEGKALPLIYENVPSTIGKDGALRIQISWFDTSNESIGCATGTLRSINGVLSCWLFTPKAAGTAIALRDAGRLRKVLHLWNSVSDCGKQVRIYAVNGPRSFDLRQGDDFHAHIITCSMVAMERVQTLR